ncbi:LysM peptidoglycan-binding domain-containing protein [Alkalihalobacillus trypoxylicola]|uniref:Phage portal protein n=1 Tax=Alkalihalobacillus trypoxylicola TaxID=519424 RepID=A0A162EWC4_9BACI|nr:LysM peptidoglycan-binding domain-containing protein [Alkalihalobacillus trypoxylicola]KYG33891.1 phage portal protein [Alkalihalobacillus trypoxylicola]
MTKSVYEFWLSQGKEKLRLPVLPEQLNIKNMYQNESVKVAKFGDLTVMNVPGAKEISFASFFPLNYSSICEYRNIPHPERVISIVEGWRKSNKPIRFMITKTKINLECSIETFDYFEGAKDIGDWDFTVTLKEYKFAKPRRIKQQVKKKVTTTTKRPSKPAPKTYTVKRGDTLWAIAVKNYGKGTEWKKIWNANKAALIKRDSRNNRQPGHWIHIGFKLVIPK